MTRKNECWHSEKICANEGCYFSVVETLQKPLTVVPCVRTVARITTETPEAIIAYSIDVARRTSRRKRPKAVKVARVEDLTWRSRLLLASRHHSSVAR
jgi:hypothetical protein